MYVCVPQLKQNYGGKEAKALVGEMEQNEANWWQHPKQD
jgi:hypothetical protein